jgi:hypothetical protein
MDDAIVLFVIVSLLVVITFAWGLRTPEARSRAQWAPRRRRYRDLRHEHTDWEER